LTIAHTLPKVKETLRLFASGYGIEQVTSTLDCDNTIQTTVPLNVQELMQSPITISRLPQPVYATEELQQAATNAEITSGLCSPSCSPADDADVVKAKKTKTKKRKTKKMIPQAADDATATTTAAATTTTTATTATTLPASPTGSSSNITLTDDGFIDLGQAVPSNGEQQEEQTTATATTTIDPDRTTTITEEFDGDFQFCIFDNRGIGRSDCPKGKYSYVAQWVHMLYSNYN
jgi:hypothetical protein